MMTAAILALGLIVSTPDTPADAESPEASFEQLCAREVENLHQFFHDWFVGDLPDTDDAFARLTGALAEDFHIISPSGNVTRRGDLLDNLRDAHGSGRESGVKIWIRGFQVRLVEGEMAVVSYEEWQERGSRKTGRVSTAVLERDPDAPGGVVWRHLHETWLPQFGPRIER